MKAQRQYCHWTEKRLPIHQLSARLSRPQLISVHKILNGMYKQQSRDIGGYATASTTKLFSEAAQNWRTRGWKTDDWKNGLHVLVVSRSQRFQCLKHHSTHCHHIKPSHGYVILDTKDHLIFHLNGRLKLSFKPKRSLKLNQYAKAKWCARTIVKWNLYCI